MGTGKQKRNPDQIRVGQHTISLRALGPMVRQARKERGELQEDAAGFFGISASALSRLERGGEPSMLVLHRMIEYLYGAEAHVSVVLEENGAAETSCYEAVKALTIQTNELTDENRELVLRVLQLALENSKKS